MSYCDFLIGVARRQREALQRFRTTQIGDVDDEPISLDLARTHCGISTFEEGSPPETASDFDEWLTDVGIPAAREYCENYLGRALAPRTMELVADTFPTYAASTPPGAGFNLPFGPVQSVTSIKYFADQATIDAAYTAAYDAEFLLSADAVLAAAAGDAAAALAALEQTMDPADYELDLYAQPARLNLAYGASWPTSRGTLNSVKVRYVVGYSLPDESPQVHILPKMVKAAMLLMLGHLFENREAVNTYAQTDLLPLGVRSLLEMTGGERVDFA